MLFPMRACKLHLTFTDSKGFSQPKTTKKTSATLPPFELWGPPWRISQSTCSVSVSTMVLAVQFSPSLLCQWSPRMNASQENVVTELYGPGPEGPGRQGLRGPVGALPEAQCTGSCLSPRISTTHRRRATATTGSVSYTHLLTVTQSQAGIITKVIETENLY